MPPATLLSTRDLATIFDRSELAFYAAPRTVRSLLTHGLLARGVATVPSSRWGGAYVLTQAGRAALGEAAP